MLNLPNLLCNHLPTYTKVGFPTKSSSIDLELACFGLFEFREIFLSIVFWQNFLTSAVIQKLTSPIRNEWWVKSMQVQPKVGKKSDSGPRFPKSPLVGSLYLIWTIQAYWQGYRIRVEARFLRKNIFFHFLNFFTKQIKKFHKIPNDGA